MIRPSQLTPAVAVAVESVTFRPRGQSPQPMPRSRSARGTSSPRHRPSQDEEMQTDRVARVASDTDSFLVDGR